MFEQKITKKATKQANKQAGSFDYQNGAGFYPCRSKKKGSRHRYRRFETAAEALRFAIEVLPAALLRGSVLEVDEARFDGDQMQTLYKADDYPLTRLPTAHQLP
ncbi:hypothetical protein ABID21_003830 [Pseudorhizobium tarimense]|uniref:Transposase n=1 Tax=Pseudorhizobium tarimense TaxID=1079109 RepID=A0ABV2HBA7_9HYPH|nr:hypothetical protein [Pseudorhizobium tarimense]MCJ8520768.1 hypothetical protein [Pseudorhizobium tarimense]